MIMQLQFLVRWVQGKVSQWSSLPSPPCWQIWYGYIWIENSTKFQTISFNFIHYPAIEIKVFNKW